MSIFKVSIFNVGFGVGEGIFLTLGDVEYKSYNNADRIMLRTLPHVDSQQRHFAKCVVCLGQGKILHHEDDSHVFYPCVICLGRGWGRR